MPRGPHLTHSLGRWQVQKLIGQNAQLTTCCKKLLQENRELRTAVAIYRGTSLQALGASTALGAGLANPAGNPVANPAAVMPEMGLMAAATAVATDPSPPVPAAPANP